MAKIYRSTITTEYRVNNLMNFYENVGDDDDKNTIYLMFGRNEPWSDREDEINFAPPYPNDSPDGKADVWARALGLIKIPKSQLRPVIPRKDWGDPDLNDSLRFTFGDIVTVNTMSINSHPSALNGYMVYRCVDIPETDPNNTNIRGTCSISTVTNKNDCVAVGGEWNAPSSPGNQENIPHGTGNAIETGDGYVWEYLYTIPPNEVLTNVTKEYIVCPFPNDIIENRVAWGLDQNIVFNENYDETIFNVGAVQLRFRAKLAGSDFIHLFGPGNNGYRQISLVQNPLLIRQDGDTEDTKATEVRYDPHEIQAGTGQIIYMENRQPIRKTLDQVEEFNLIYNF
ncbi:baseplate wedge subunit [Vibrio phage phi-Grn1]|uniref:Baseplate wedge subunit n=1 Tax=Vibrio phage phi-Grn1 TaxID=1747713 RepID=A0A126HGC1_9CAUD|nr:baseplate wedge subunit [Vibrio phage phi-Grn1]